MSRISEHRTSMLAGGQGRTIGKISTNSAVSNFGRNLTNCLSLSDLRMLSPLTGPIFFHCCTHGVFAVQDLELPSSWEEAKDTRRFLRRFRWLPCSGPVSPRSLRPFPPLCSHLAPAPTLLGLLRVAHPISISASGWERNGGLGLGCLYCQGGPLAPTHTHSPLNLEKRHRAEDSCGGPFPPRLADGNDR
jgi:hypothetical protein